MPTTSGELDTSTMVFQWSGGSVTVYFTSDAYVAESGFVLSFTKG